MKEPTRLEIPHLRAWRLHRLLSQSELAKKAGVAKNTVLRLEKSGERANELVVHKLANALDVAVQSLLEEEPPAKKQPAA